MQPGDHVEARGDAPAVVVAGSGTTVTYAELDERSKRLAQLFRAAGLADGDHIAILLENNPRYFEVYWGAQRAGLYITPINWHLTAEEAGYIVEDCGARAVITSAAVAEVAAGLEPMLGGVDLRLVMDGDLDGWDRYETAIAAQPAEALEQGGRVPHVRGPVDGVLVGAFLPADPDVDRVEILGDPGGFLLEEQAQLLSAPPQLEAADRQLLDGDRELVLLLDVDVLSRQLVLVEAELDVGQDAIGDERGAQSSLVPALAPQALDGDVREDREPQAEDRHRREDLEQGEALRATSLARISRLLHGSAPSRAAGRRRGRCCGCRGRRSRSGPRPSCRPSRRR